MPALQTLSHPENPRGFLGLRIAQFRRASCSHLPASQIQNGDAVPSRNMFGQGAATTQLDVVGMGANGENINRRWRRHSKFVQWQSYSTPANCLISLVRGEVVIKYEAVHWPLFIDQKFAEVPTHIRMAVAILLFLGQPLVHRMDILPFDGDLFHHLEGHPVIFAAEGLDFASAEPDSWPPKSLHGKPKMMKSSWLALIPKGLQVLVLGSKTAFGRRIDNQNALAPKLLKVKLFSLQCVGTEAVKIDCAVHRLGHAVSTAKKHSE